MSSRRFMGAVLAALVGSACSELSPRPGEQESLVSLEAAFAPGICDDRDLKKHVRDYFSRPEERAAVDTADDIDAACELGDQGAADGFVLDLFSVVADAIAAGNEGDPADGALLVAEALSFASFDCAACNFQAALSIGGAFEVVGMGDVQPIVARGLPLGDTWVIEVGPNAADWHGVFGTRTLVVGAPASAQVPLNETALPPIQYQWEAVPDMPGFVAQPIVGVCHTAIGPAGIPTVQRNSTLLQPSGVAACATLSAAPPAPRSLGDRIRRMAGMLLGAQPLHASAQGGGGTGGRPGDFSTFAAVDAIVSGRLFFVTQPAPVNTAGQPIGGPVQVQALTDNGTPIENVLIELSAEVNNGSKVTITGNQAITREGGGIATFPNVAINKPGGYTLCARVIGADGYTIAGTCSNPLHIRNAN